MHEYKDCMILLLKSYAIYRKQQPLSGFSELAARDACLKGYVKPMFSDIVIVDRPDKKNSSFTRWVWESVITFFGFVLKNKPKDSFAARVPVEGNLNDPNVEIWPLITNIFKNAFITAFKKEVDNDINFSDATPKKK